MFAFLANWSMLLIPVTAYLKLQPCFTNMTTASWIMHCLTPEKGVHSFRYFRLQMHTPNSIVDCSCMYAFCVRMRLICGGVRIQSHFNTKCIHARGNNNMIWCTHLGQEVPEWVYALFWCKTVNGLISKIRKCTRNCRKLIFLLCRCLVRSRNLRMPCDSWSEMSNLIMIWLSLCLKPTLGCLGELLQIASITEGWSFGC